MGGARRRRVGAAALLLAAVVAAGACSSGGGGGDGAEPELDLPPATTPADTALGASGPGTTVDRSSTTGDVLVLLDPTISAAQQGALQELVQDVPGVEGVRYVSQQAAYEEYRCLYAGQPQLLARVTPGSLPASLRVDTGGDLGVATQVQLAVRGGAGVLEVIVPSATGDAGPAATAPVTVPVEVGRC